MQALKFYNYDQTVSSVSHLLILNLNINNIDLVRRKQGAVGKTPRSVVAKPNCLRQAWSTYL